MPANEYRFVSHWRVRAPREAVFEILEKPLTLTRWWPQVYLSVEETEPDVFAVHSKGWLPYTLRWKFRRTATDKPHSMALEAWGDLTGRGLWTLEQAGDETAIEYDWSVSADKPLLRYLSLLFKPIFAANHRWAMALGEEGLRAYLKSAS
jgi:hypothetical protein